MSTDGQSSVTIVDVKIGFWSMVVLMVKAAIAFIPAMIILGVIGAAIGGVVMGAISG